MNGADIRGLNNWELTKVTHRRYKLQVKKMKDERYITV